MATSLHVVVLVLLSKVVLMLVHVSVSTSLHVVVLYVVLLTAVGVMPLRSARVLLSKLARAMLPSAGHWWYYHQRPLGVQPSPGHLAVFWVLVPPWTRCWSSRRRL